MTLLIRSIVAYLSLHYMPELGLPFNKDSCQRLPAAELSSSIRRFLDRSPAEALVGMAQVNPPGETSKAG